MTMNSLNKVKLDISIDTQIYNAVEINGVEYFREDWMVFKMIEYAKAKLEQFKDLNKSTDKEWLDFKNNKELFNQEAKKNCLIKFKDGTVIRYREDHPMEIMTHFKMADKVCPGVEACEKTDNACTFYDPCSDCELKEDK